MAILYCKKNGKLVPTTTPIEEDAPIEIGKPIAISLLGFYPGYIKKDWGRKAEIMITSEIRFGPLNRAAPKRINMLFQGYDFKKAEPVSNWGGDIYGDPMLYYSKAYAGQKVGMTLRGVEADKFDPKTWEGIDNLINRVGSLALFTAAAPYLGYLGIAKNLVKILIGAISRNDRLQISRTDLFFGEEHRKILQTGRYVIWNPQREAMSPTLKNKYKLTGRGDDEVNWLVSIKDGSRYKVTPYFVIKVDRIPRKDYEGFEIGAGSAKILESWGDKPLTATVFDSIQQIAEQVNDAKQLSEIEDLINDLKKAETAEEKQKIKEMIKAHTELFTKNNSAFLNELLASYVK